MQCNAVGIVEAALCWVTMSRVVSHGSKQLYRLCCQGGEATVLCLRASIADEVARSVVGHLFLRCVCGGRGEHSVFVERGAVQPGPVWSRARPCNHVDCSEWRVSVSVADKPASGPGRAM
jgi:hypothetical protein